MDLHDICALALAESGRKVKAEVFAVRTGINAAYIDDSQISNMESKEELGIAVRAFQGDRLGQASMTVEKEEDVIRCVRKALSACDLAVPDAKVKGPVPPQTALIEEPKVFDSRLSQCDAIDLGGLALEVVDSCAINVPRGLIRSAVIETRMMNDLGNDVSRKGTMAYAHFTSMFHGRSPGEGVESYHGTALNMNASVMGEVLREKAKRSAEAVAFKGSESLQVILPPSELGDMLMSSAGSALNGENVVNGRSKWGDSMDSVVCSESLTIIDDPSTPAPLCARYDDEGTPARRKTFIDGGVLRSFLFDSYNGESTGNGLRRSSEDPQESYFRSLAVRPMNMRVMPGDHSFEEMVEGIKDGILVEKLAWPEADPFTGRFALELRCGILIRNGRFAGTVKGALLTGNMLDSLGQVLMIGDDPVVTGLATVPSMAFGGMRLVGD